MRLLLETELESVFGGQDAGIVATTLSMNYVTASAAGNPTDPYTSGPAFATAGTYESGGQVRVCYANYYKSLPDVPHYAAIKCVSDHVDYPGELIDPSYREVEVNAYQFTNVGDVSGLNHLAVSQSSTPPSGYTYSLYGLTQSNSSYKQTSVSAAGLSQHSGSYTYTDPVTKAQNLTLAGPFSAEEQTIIIYGHEASHQHGLGGTPAEEQQAWGYGEYALNNYRNNKASIDAACGTF